MKKNAAPKPKMYYVYTLVDPREDKIFYIGKGKEKRPFAHRVEANAGCECKKCQMIRSIWDAGYDVRLNYVYETEDERAALLREKQLIARIGLRRLCNLRPGHISTKVETWDAPLCESERQYTRYNHERDILAQKAREIETGVLSPRQVAYWQKRIEEFGPELKASPNSWLDKI